MAKASLSQRYKAWKVKIMTKSKIPTPLKSKNQLTREQWLNMSVNELTPLFNDNGYKLPKVRVSVGFSIGGSPHKTLGSHFSPDATKDKIGQIYISPKSDDSLSILATLTHELVHASVGNKAGHGPKFKICALKVGLTGKMRSTTAGPILTERLNAIIKKIGPINHGAITLDERKKQSTRMIKMQCLDCGYVARTVKKHLDNYGPLLCPCNRVALSVEQKEE